MRPLEYIRANRADVFAFAGIFVAALAARLAFVLPVRPVPVSDFGWYLDRAIGLVHGLGYTLNGHPTALWPPGWPYVLAGIVGLFGPSVLAIEIFQAILNALLAVLAFLIAREVFGRSAGIAAGCAYAILPSAVEWNATLASEPLYALLCALGIYIWIKCAPRQLGWFALSGVVLGAAALVRPSALLYWIVLLAYVLAVRSERAQLRVWAGAVAATVLCTVIVISPMIVRNYYAFGTFVLISNNGGVSLYEGNNPSAGGSESVLRNREIERLLLDPRTEPQGDKLASKLAITYMLAHPAHELVLALKKVKALYVSDDSMIRFTLRSRHFREPVSPPPSDRLASALVVVNTVAYYALMLFALYGVILCFVKRGVARTPRWGILLGLILYNTAVFAVITGVERYRYPMMPYFSVFAGLGLIAAWSFVRARTGVPAKPLQQLNPERARTP